MLFWLGLACGGALGALIRYGIQLALSGRLAHTPWATFPLATLLVNVAGSFALAFVVTLSLRGALSSEWRLIIGTGFIGALTTFSTLEWETYLLLRDNDMVRATLSVVANLMLGFVAVLLGRALALAWTAAR
ncbi:fluoride efflux transporter CrcB [Deinococcus multiflagellatus]|uniref:Fluoride-specific ion channel FluC n=1 Tax=Deinococcus multiflagellatus TaxID=1656887 RepID=A0ABW1ZS61_9DEIO|nr:fluoride efflux transporter CrcB [Deinococcus multiflagellatus]MBZ9715430.1 fluoride efflux transporter CrcB [Deinococcus multiflagellatus]